MQYTKKEYNSLGFEILYKTENELIESKGNFSYELEYASDELRNNRDRVYKLCLKNKNSYNLKYVNDKLKGHKEFVKRLLNLDGSCCKYISETLKSDEEIMLLSISKEVHNIQYISNSLLNNETFLNKVIVVNKEAVEFINVLKNSSNRTNKDIGKNLEKVIEKPLFTPEEEKEFLIDFNKKDLENDYKPTKSFNNQYESSSPSL